MCGSRRPLVDGVRHADRRFGSAARPERLRGQISEVEDRLRHTLLRCDRAPLAGWNSLDIGALGQAWTHGAEVGVGAVAVGWNDRRESAAS